MREQFLAALFNGPLLPADAVVVLSGDGMVRPAAALGLLQQGIGQMCVVMGGLDNPPHSMSAKAMRDYLIERSMPMGRILMEAEAQDTHEQAETLAGYCAANAWDRVILVTSAYHMPRAFLTVLASLQRAGIEEKVHVVPLPAYARWSGNPEGLDVTRLELLTAEFAKIEQYGGHVASYAEGLAYLEDWE